MEKKSHKFLTHALIALACLNAVVWYAALAQEGSRQKLSLYFLDVGQGDSELIILPGGIKLLVDGGPPNGKLLEALGKILPPGDHYIDLVLLTHPQLDHFGGLIDLIKNYEVGMFIDNGRKGEIAAYGDFTKILEEKRVKRVVVGEGDRIMHATSRLSILSPNKYEAESRELNDTCLVFMLEDGNIKALYTGDIGFDIENRLVAHYNLASAVLKIPHHGSRFSSGEKFLESADPKIAVIEVGKNRYGHPTQQTLRRLQEREIKIFRTDQNGTLKIEHNNNQLKVIKA